MRILIRAGELFDGYEWRENADVLIEDGVVKSFSRPAGSVDMVLETPIAIPGLVDAHVHIVCDMRPRHAWISMRNHGLLLLIHGVVAVRDLGNAIDFCRNYIYMNPELTVQYSIAIDVPPYPWFFMRPVTKPEDGVKEVERAFVEGASWVKLYDRITEDIARAVIARARELGLKIAGHTTTIGFRRAIEIGFNSIEHITSLVDPIEAKSYEEYMEKLVEKWERLDEGTIEEHAKVLRSYGVSLIPTLALFRSSAKSPIVDKRKYSKYISPWYRYVKAKRQEFKRIYSRLAKALKILWENGVRIVAGTDMPNQALNPGISLWEELYSYVEAGINPREVLKAATSNAARLMDIDIGIVDIGRKANLVLLHVRPFEKPRIEIDKVVIGIQILDPNQLKLQLKKIPMFGF